MHSEMIETNCWKRLLNRERFHVGIWNLRYEATILSGDCGVKDQSFLSFYGSPKRIEEIHSTLIIVEERR